MTDKPLKSLNFGGADTYYPAPSIMKAIEATSTDGSSYTVTVPGITELTKGISIFIMPNMNSTNALLSLNVNNLGYKNIKRRLTTGTGLTNAPIKSNWWQTSKPIRLTYDGSQWLADEYTKPDASDLDGAVPIANGGTGATTAAQALQNLGITYGTADLTAGTSELATGALYFVHE